LDALWASAPHANRLDLKIPAKAFARKALFDVKGNAPGHTHPCCEHSSIVLEKETQ
jgi:hypothetical protein